MKVNMIHIVIVIMIFHTISLNAQVVVKAGSSITIKDGFGLYINTNLTLESNATGSGYLADQTSNNNINITGNIDVQRYITANGWHNVSNPVNSTNTSIFTGTDLTFYYDETKILNDWNFGWVWYQGPMFTMKGYDLFLDQNAITVNYTATNSSYLNTGSYNIDIKKTDVADGETENHKGWNLIGNPYPSPLDWLEESGWNKSDINDAKYIWNPSANNYTIFLGGSNPVGVNGGTQYIPSNQGFWVQATTNGNISVNNAARKGVITSTPDYYKNSEILYPFISIIAKANSMSDETLIRFLPSTTSKFDLNYDAIKLISGSEIVPQISTEINNLNFCINSLPQIIDGLEIKLDFSCAKSGNYCISLSEKSNLGSINNLFLYDKLEKNLVNLSFNNEYWFDHNTFNSNQRFILIINPNEEDLIQLKQESPFLIYANNEGIKITNLDNLENSYSVEIINLLGQSIIHKTIFDKQILIKPNIESGYYIIRIRTKNNQYNSKIFIHNR